MHNFLKRFIFYCSSRLYIYGCLGCVRFIQSPFGRTTLFSYIYLCVDKVRKAIHFVEHTHNIRSLYTLCLCGHSIRVDVLPNRIPTTQFAHFCLAFTNTNSWNAFVPLFHILLLMFTAFDYIEWQGFCAMRMYKQILKIFVLLTISSESASANIT